MSERNLIDSALVQWKKDYLSMETDLKQKQTLITELQVIHNFETQRCLAHLLL